MRVRALVGVGIVVALAAIGGACKAKGNGVGTAPPDVPCPATIGEGSPCGDSVNLCGICSGTCGNATVCNDESGVASQDPPFNMYCPGGPGAAWICVQPGDGGTFNDAESGGEVDGDAPSEAETDGDADAAESETQSDADADVVTDAGTDAIDEADVPADTAPEVDLDADADGD